MAQQIGRYELIRELRRGGMATVYLAYDPRMQREVAVKVLPRQFTHDPRFLALFEQEARIIAALEDPGIVPIYDFGEYYDSPYLVMRYLAGGTLGDLMWRQHLDLVEISRILNLLAPALDAAHGRGIIHRDMKPDNVLFDEAGRPYLADFGIARLADLTQTMTVTGTPAYMSPEQVQGQLQLDGRSDIYSLGVMLYEILAGRLPYEAQTAQSQMYMHVMEPPPFILAANPNLPPQTQAVIEKVMAKDREDRYQTAVELAAAVQGLLHVPLSPDAGQAQHIDREATNATGRLKRKEKHPVLWYRLPAWARVAVGIIIVLLLIFGSYWLIIGRGPEPAAPGPTPTWDNPFVTSTPEAISTLPAVILASSTVTLSTAPWDPNSPRQNPVLGSYLRREQDQMRMVYVPPGSFAMGSEVGDGAEAPVHSVTLDGFWIDETEVTNGRYIQCVNAGQCTASGMAGDAAYNGTDQPVVGISWNNATAYCRWAGAQLPSEAQWEYAARGPAGNSYPWGEQEPSCALAQYEDCGVGTVTVGSFRQGASWVEALDMAGNAWEWVNDSFDPDYYSRSPSKNPPGSTSGSEKVVRGGGWDSNRSRLRSAYRGYGEASKAFLNIGFRCAMAGR